MIFQSFRFEAKYEYYLNFLIILQKDSEYKANATGFDFAEPGIGKMVLYNFAFVLIGIAIILLLENKNIFSKLFSLIFEKNGMQTSYSKIQDEDVLKEQERICNAELEENSCQYQFLVKNINKIYKNGSKKFQAVNNLTFGVKSAECFG